MIRLKLAFMGGNMSFLKGFDYFEVLVGFLRFR